VFDRLLIGQHRWLLTVTSADRSQDPAVARYITEGEAAGVDTAVLCRQRTHWYDLAHDVVIPDVLVGAMTRGVFRFIENSVGAAITKNLYGWRWHPTTGSKTRKRVLTWLRSEFGQAALAAAARRQGDGLLKLEPRALRDVVVPESVLK
jgi:hypothetical protein